MNEIITSKANNIIKSTKKLYERKYRKEYGLFIIEGERFVFDAADSGIVAEYIISTEKYRKAVETKYAKEVYIVTEEVYRHVSALSAPKGIMGIYRIPKEDTSKIEANKIIFLDNVQNPDNVGAIIRSAVCAGYDELFLNDGCADVYSDKSVRASAGSIFRIGIRNITTDKMLEFAATGYQIITTDLCGNEKIDSIKDKFILVIGNEGNGVSNQIKERSDLLLKIPIYGNCQSLNAACAASILMYKLIGY